jgi:hypothetical protein
MKIELKKEKKKAAIINLTRIIKPIDGGTHFGRLECVYLKEYLQKFFDREVDFVSRKTKKEWQLDIDSYKDVSEVNLNDYDEVWIHNSPFNLYGGVLNTHSLQLFYQLCDFSGDIFYAMYDPKLPCMNFAQYLKYRQMHNNGKIRVGYSTNYTLTEIDLSKIDKFTNDIWPRITIAFNGMDYEKYVSLYNKKHEKLFIDNPEHIAKLYDRNWCEVHYGEYLAITDRQDLKLQNYDYSNKKYDLVYYGNNRYTNRNKIIKNIYDKDYINALFIGYDPKFTHAETTVFKYLHQDELLPLICTSYATIVCGDDLHNEIFLTARFFEAMLLDTVGLIYNSYDPEHKLISDKKLADFIYVETAEDVRDRLNQIKNNETFYREIVEAERKEILNNFTNKYIPK